MIGHSLNLAVNFFSTKYVQHSSSCPSLPEHMKVYTRSMDELPCYTEHIEGWSENEDNDTGEGCGTSEEERSGITSNTESVPDTADDSLTHHSTQDEEYEAREPCDSFVSLDKREPLGSIISEVNKSPPLKLPTREEMIEVVDFTSPMNKSSAEMSQADCCKQSGAISANRSEDSSTKEKMIEVIDFTSPVNNSSAEMSQADCKQPGAISGNKSEELRFDLDMSNEAEIIDLSTPAACDSFSVGKKRRKVTRAVGGFIDLTKSPNFIQL